MDRLAKAQPARASGKSASEFVRWGFPRTWYSRKWRLVIWHPKGVFTATFADQIIAFMERREDEQDAPYDRYIDFSGLTDIRLRFDHVLTIARRRGKVRQPVKSAFVASNPIAFAIAEMYEHMMAEAMIDVRAFRERKLAAAWLELPESILQPP